MHENLQIRLNTFGTSNKIEFTKQVVLKCVKSTLTTKT